MTKTVPIAPICVFLFDELKKGYPNHSLLGDDAVFVCTAVTETRYCLYQQAGHVHPSMAHVSLGRGYGCAVQGEVYEIAPDVMIDLQRYYGCDDFSHCVQLDVTCLATGECYVAYGFTIVPCKRGFLAAAERIGAIWDPKGLSQVIDTDTDTNTHAEVA